MKFHIIVADPPWMTDDELSFSKTKRSAVSQYDVLDSKSIIDLPVNTIVQPTSILCLWVIGSMMEEGMETVKSWGFKQKQSWVWVKTKKDALEPLEKQVLKIIKKESPSDYRSLIKHAFDEFAMDEVLNFYMGHLFRQTHELVLIGARGNYTKLLKNKSQRSVHLSQIGKHSEKPEALQDRLDIMFPDSSTNKLELFARRDRAGWECAGNECPSTYGEDIRDSIERLSKMP